MNKLFYTMSRILVVMIAALFALVTIAALFNGRVINFVMFGALTLYFTGLASRKLKNDF